MSDEVTGEDVQERIRVKCDNIRDMLIGKNRKYGNSAIYPLRVFHRGHPVDAIDARIDDKLARKANEAQRSVEDEDIELDLVGYLILRMVAIDIHGAPGVARLVSVLRPPAEEVRSTLLPKMHIRPQADADSRDFEYKGEDNT